MLYKRRRERNREKKKVTEIIKKTIGTKLITNTKKLKLKIQSRAWNFRNTMLKKRRRRKAKQNKTRSKNYKKIYIYMKFAVKKIGSFFFAK